MFSMRWFSTIFMIFLLTACGGGGSIEKNSSGDGGTDTDEYALALSLNSPSGSSELSVSNPIQIQATVTKDGEKQADRLVKFVGDEFSEFNGTSSVLTNSEGIAEVNIVANSNQGAGAISASFDVNGQTITKSIEYAAIGDGGIQIALEFKDANGNEINTENKLAGENAATVMATLTNNGVALPNELLTFTFDELIDTPSNGRIVTNGSGQALVQVNATDQIGAGTISVAFEDETATLNFASDGYEFFNRQVYELSVVGLDAQGQETSDLSFNTPIAIRATLTLNDKPVADEPLTFSVDKALLGTVTNVLKTDSSGSVTFNLIDNNESGVGVLNVSFDAPGDVANVSSSFSFESEGDGGLQLSVIVADSEGVLISDQNRLGTGKNGSVKITLVDNGEPLSDVIVTVNSGTKAVTIPSDGKVITNAQGEATLTLVPNILSGVDTLTVTYTTESETVTRTVNYHSDGDEFFGIEKYEIALSGQNASGTSSNQLSFVNPLTVRALLTLNGSPVSGQNINFTVNDKGLLSNSVLETGVDGVAAVVLTENNVDGAGVLTATYTTEDNVVITKDFSFISAGDGGLQMTLTVNDQTDDKNPINQQNPLNGATRGLVEVTLSNNGNLVSGAIVNVSSGGKAVTVPSDGQAATQQNGKASLELVANKETGIGQLSATYTDPTTSETVTEQYIYYSDGDPDFSDSEFELLIVARNALGVETKELSGDSELTLTATLLQNGSAFENQLIQFTVNEFGTLDPQSGSVLTNSSGIAEIKLKDNSVQGAGRVIATFTSSSGVPVSRNFNFNSQGDGGLLLVIESITGDEDKDIKKDNAIGKDQNGTVTALLTEDGQPVSNALVTFTVDEVATMEPSNGRAVTNSEGRASVELLTTRVSGVGEIFAEYQGLRTNNALFHSLGDAEAVTGDYSFDIQLLTGCNDDWDAVRNDVNNPIDPETGGCTTVTSLDSSVLPELFIQIARVTDDAKEVDNQIIEVITDKGQVLPSSGKVLTDVNGIALLKLQPGDSDGAGTISVTFDNQTATENFSVGIQELYLQLSADLPSSPASEQPLPELDSGDSFIITARVYTDEALTTLYEQPVDIGFSSVCASQQPAGTLATIDSPVRSQAGVATSTYQASGCNGNDTITASISAADPASYPFFVNTAPVQSLKFISASDRFIGLPPATGSVPVTSTITFQLIDTDDNPLRQKQIEFRFADLTGEATLNTYKGNTDSNGEAKTLIEGGVVPGGLVVEACYLLDDVITAAAQNLQFPTCWQSKIDQCSADSSLEFCELPDALTNGFMLIPAGDQINAVSSGVILSSGVPDQDSFDAAPDRFILNTQNYVNVTTNINVYFGDQFNQLSRDDLVANVQAEAGVIGNIDGSGGDESYQCFADKGRCQVQWRSQGDLPFTDPKWLNRIGDVCDTYKGLPVPCIGDYPETVTENGVTRTVVRGARVTILATAKGQENFHDKPSTDTIPRKNGLFDIGEFQPLNDDLPEAFIDFNGNNQFDAVDCQANNDDPSTDPCEPTLSNGGHNEVYLDANNNGVYDGLPDDPTTGIYNGLLCGQAAEEAGQCSKDLVDIRKQFEIVASSDIVYTRFVVNKSHIGGGDCVNTVGPIDSNDPNSNIVTFPNEGLFGLEATESDDYCDIDGITLGDFDGNDENETESVTVEIYFSDLYGNSLPEETEISIATTNGVVNIIELSSTVYFSAGFERGKAVVEVTPETTSNSRDTGNLTITFEIPSPSSFGETITRTKSIIIRDNG
ncbi:hypothetical protein N476_11335 [Pseudoalteromonas luteoviolacea H33]|uniref:Big-1 domain-containing protein n=2 Tax=Pseudoalteromonas luteoviolacea TaxID=43657 RepID=A0A167FFG0_9GAMM|nr:hypothetical protein N476_11335 [Pseudoalteromonas luteoviolacea H33]KZN77141.1 hypothetical protein N477_12970 [Pseudoalteromonas luteoviolacea H33-S]